MSKLEDVLVRLLTDRSFLDRFKGGKANLAAEEGLTSPRPLQ